MRVLFAIPILFLCAVAFAQQGSYGIMTERPHDCRDIRYNCARMLAYFYVKNDIDSFKLTLGYWNRHCGMSEEIFRLNCLAEIKKGSFIIPPGDSRALDYFSAYEQNKSGRHNQMRWHNPTPSATSDTGTGLLIDSLGTLFASHLLPAQKENCIEHLVVSLYANRIPTIYDSLGSTKYVNAAALQAAYSKAIKNAIGMPEYQFGLIAGVWMPTGNAALLGIHPQLGVQAGYRRKKLMLAISICYKFLDSERAYTVSHEGNLKVTRSFSGLYTGFEAGYEVAGRERNRAYVVAGIGPDFLTMIKGKKPILSWNFNAGLGARHMFSNRIYLGLESRYNFLDYKNPGGSVLSGNAVTTSLTCGIFVARERKKLLEKIHYKGYD